MQKSSWKRKTQIAFKDDMPKTLVGKVAYRVLEEEELKEITRSKDKIQTKMEV